MAEVTNAELTTDILNGTGTLDVLMKSLTVSLDEQFKKARITGTDYANVYLGAVNALVPQAVAFVLGKQQADKQAELTQKQIDLVDAQLLKEALERDLLTLEATIKTNENVKLLSEIALVDSQNAIAQAQLLKEPLERNILIQEEAIKIAQEADVIAGTNKTNAEVTKISKENLILDQQLLIAAEQVLKEPVERAVLAAEEDLKIAQTAKVAAETSNLATENTRIAAQTTLLGTQNAVGIQEELIAAKKLIHMNDDNLKVQEEIDMLIAQQSKITEEISLLEAKRYTEKAQHSSTLPDASAVSGVVGKQLELFEEQRKGYESNTKQKLLNALLDPYAILIGNNPDVPIPDGLDKGNVDDVINSLRTAINLANSTPG